MHKDSDPEEYSWEANAAAGEASKPVAASVTGKRVAFTDSSLGPDTECALYRQSLVDPGSSRGGGAVSGLSSDSLFAFTSDESPHSPKDIMDIDARNSPLSAKVS